MRSARKRVLLVALAFAVAPLLLTVHAQQKGQQTQKSQATFRVRIEYVEVDAIVNDKSGNFIADLKKDEFEVFEDGKKQNVERLELVNVPVEPRPTEALIAGKGWEPDVYTNDTPPGRVYLIVMDDLHVHPARTQAARRIAREFIEKNLAPNDVAAIVVTSGNRKRTQEFTSSKRALLEAVDKFQGQKVISPGLAALSTIPGAAGEGSSTQADPQRMFNARSMLDTLAGLATFAGTIHNRKKSIVLVGEGPDIDIAASEIRGNFAWMPSVSPGAINNGEGQAPRDFKPPDGFPLARRELRDKLRDFIDAANRSNVTLYAFDPSMYTQGGDDMVDIASANPGDYDADYGFEIVRSSKVWDDINAAQDNLRSISTQTGGFVTISRSFPKAFERIRNDNSHYYVLGYYPTNDKRDGKFRKIEVKVKRTGTTIIARRGYVAPKGDKTDDIVVVTKEGTTPPLREALLSALPTAGLPIAVTVAPFRGAPGKASILMMLQTAPGSVKFVDGGGKFDGKLEVSFVAIDELGKTVTGERLDLSMPLKPDTYKAVNESGMVVESRINLPPGRYVLRIGARDLIGDKVGAVHCDLQVPDYTKVPLALSGVVLGSARSNAANPRPDRERASMLPETPSVMREFRQNDEITALAEIYDLTVATPHQIDIISSVVGEDGREVFRREDKRSSAEIMASGGTGGGFGYLVKMPLANMAPGSYLFKIEARSRLQVDKPVSHETAFKVVGN